MYQSDYQRALFTLAASTYDIASAVLNDCTNPAEFQGRTYDWARNLAKHYAENAQAFKIQALEVCSVEREPVKFNRAQRRYSEAVTRHLRLRAEYTAPIPEDGTSGQDRESYTDDQDRESYTVTA